MGGSDRSEGGVFSETERFPFRVSEITPENPFFPTQNDFSFVPKIFYNYLNAYTWLWTGYKKHDTAPLKELSSILLYVIPLGGFQISRPFPYLILNQ